MLNVRCKGLAGAACVALMLALAGCTSVGNVGLMVRSSADAARLAAGKYEELGYAEATGCRYFIIGILPLGNADPGYVLDQALHARAADALINVTTSNSLLGFVPIYNVFSITCTSIKGTAIRFAAPS